MTRPLQGLGHREREKPHVREERLDKISRQFAHRGVVRPGREQHVAGKHRPPVQERHGRLVLKDEVALRLVPRDLAERAVRFAARVSGRSRAWPSLVMDVCSPTLARMLVDLLIVGAKTCPSLRPSEGFSHSPADCKGMSKLSPELGNFFAKTIGDLSAQPGERWPATGPCSRRTSARW